MVGRTAHLAVIGERRALVRVPEHRRLVLPEPGFRTIVPCPRGVGRRYLGATRCFRHPDLPGDRACPGRAAGGARR